jgi:hypothetical protein
MRLQYLLALPLLAAGPVLAQDLGSPTTTTPPNVPSTGTVGQSASLSRLDADRDGSISFQEAAANPDLNRQFLQYDRNSNGVLEPPEFARFEATQAGLTTGTTGPSSTATPPGAPSAPGGTAAGSPSSPGTGAGVPPPAQDQTQRQPATQAPR